MVDCSYRAVDALIEVAAGCYGRREGPPLTLPPAEKKRPYCPWRSRLPECMKPDCCLTGLSSAMPPELIPLSRVGWACSMFPVHPDSARSCHPSGSVPVG